MAKLWLSSADRNSYNEVTEFPYFNLLSQSVGLFEENVRLKNKQMDADIKLAEAEQLMRSMYDKADDGS